MQVDSSYDFDAEEDKEEERAEMGSGNGSDAQRLEGKEIEHGDRSPEERGRPQTAKGRDKDRDK